ncbi:hypothetical protein ACX80E_14895 [Arthrobacter sp. TMN-49]
MTIDPSFRIENELAEFLQTTLSCSYCHTASYLMVESIESLRPKVSGQVSVEYSCGRCDAFFAHDAPVGLVAKLLMNCPTGTGVLKFGRYYIHCGEPMEKAKIRISKVQPSAEGLDPAPAVWLPSKVMRCHCGFQMSIPT